MIELMAFLTSMLATSIIAAGASCVLFRDYREGFRILYHLIDSQGSHSLPHDTPNESRRPLSTQLLFAAGCLTVASAGYVWLSSIFKSAAGA